MEQPNREEVVLLEKAVIGGCLRWPDEIDEAVQVLGAKHFSVYAHQVIFGAMVSLRERGEPILLTSVAEELCRRGQTADAPYCLLADLFESMPTGAQVRFHSECVRDDAIRRALSRACLKLHDDAVRRLSPANELLETAEQTILEIVENDVPSGAVPLPTVLDETFSRIDLRLRENSASSGLRTGLSDLDVRIVGFQSQSMNILAARPSVGKTALAMWIAVNTARNGGAVYFASLEQSRHELCERLLCAEAGVDGHNLRRGVLTAEEIAQLVEARNKLASIPLFFDDSQNLTMLRIAAGARRTKRRHGLSLLVVDYLQLIEPERDGQANFANRQEQVAHTSRRLKHLSRDLDCPVLALSQLNRSSETRADSRPRLSDLRDSGAIEQDADVVLLLHQPDRHADRVEILIEKNRNGPIGTVDVVFDRRYMRFRDAF